jgi:hypothetical protein
MSYAAIAVALLVLLVLFKIMKGLLKIFVLLLLVLAAVYYFNTEPSAPAEQPEKSSSIW